MSTLSLTEAKNKRKGIKAMATRIKHFLDSSDTAQLSTFDISERIKKLNSLWNQYDEVQSRIEDLELNDFDDADETALHKQHTDERVSFETPYFNLAARLEAAIHEIEQRQNPREVARPQNSIPRTQVNAASSHVRLPKIDLPTFTGNYENWYAFYDTFAKLIDENADLSKIQKFHYLRSSLKGEAADVVRAFEITTENYAEAWGLVIEQYDDRPRIIAGHVKSLFDLPSVSKKNHTQLRALLDGAFKHLRSLKALDRHVDYWDDVMIQLFISKLDATTIMEWKTSRLDSSIPTFKQLTDFLRQRCIALESVTNESQGTTIPVSNNNSQRSKRVVSNSATANLSCDCCKGNHFLYQCETFKKFPVDKRFRIAKNSQLCINCLRTSKHQAKDCPSSSCRKCHKTHNTLLHFESKVEQGSPNADTSSDNKEGSTPVVTQCSYQNPSRIFLSTAIIHVFDAKGKIHACRALLDSGSQLNLLTEEFAKKLQLTKQSINIPISGIARGDVRANDSVNVTIQSRFNSFKERVNCIVLPAITQKLPQNFIHSSRFRIPSNINLADPNFNIPRDIDILIGAELFWRLICIGQIKGCKDHPMLQKTTLGWIIAGSFISPLTRDNSASCNLVTTEELERNISRFWQVENNYCNDAEALNPNDQFCETLFQESTSRNNEGRFVVKLPVRGDMISQLGETRKIAERRFFALEKRLIRQPQVYNEYRKFMREYQELNHMSQITDSAERDISVHYYLPHHAVHKETSATTKLRVVFDASCRASSGRSLNDALFVGPTIQQDLFAILSRFRTFRVALTADIAKMYRQILVDPSQHCLQRILWRDSPQHELNTFELVTLTYGTDPASFLAIRTLQRLAQEHSTLFSLGSKVLLRDFYVDDMLSGASTLDEALSIKNQTTSLLQSGGFELRKWFSNDPSLRDDDIAINKEIGLDLEGCKTRVLGVCWNCERDTFNFANSSECRPLARLTKRNILSRIALIFDPLGLLGPIIIIGKLTMQELWLLKIDWDESIPMNIGTQWLNYEQQLRCLSNIEIPRRIVVDDVVIIELHGFSDASNRAYGACVYLRSISKTGQVNVRLIASKSRVAPIKSISIPRLELCGAVLLAQLVDKLKGCLSLQINAIYYWTDSSIVIHWLRGSSRNWNTFVANRVGEVQSLTLVEDWHYVASKDNPADLISRGVMPEALSQLDIWWHGPKWLELEGSKWPAPVIDVLNDIPEKRRSDKSITSHVMTAKSEFDIFERFSSYRKLIRIFALCLKFVSAIRCNQRGRKRDTADHGIRSKTYVVSRSDDDFENAELTIVKILQSRAFNQEINDISKFGIVNKKSSILKLTPFLDDDGILRVGGRLKHANIPYNAKHPMLIPSRHSFTRLITLDEHKRLLHAGAQMTLSSIRQRFWPCAGRSTVRDIVSKCVICFRNAPKLSNTLMGNLPESRVSVFARPFEKCGIDYAGPVYYKEGQRKNSRSVKCFIAIFVCFATKATHIELVADLTSEAFLNALKRFISRRGRPSDIYSDNGLNFVGANHELNELYDMLNDSRSKQKIVDTICSERIKWHFIPPRAPHMGGLWEAAVKAAKFHLKRIIGEASLKYDEFVTLLIRVEAILNSRPLTPLSADPNDFSVLTAAHFLIGGPITAYPEPCLEDINMNRLSRWQRVEQLRQQFWRRWTKEYLHNCQQRAKWNDVKTPLAVGQLVIVREDNLPPLVWALGRIEEVNPGDDDIVRAALVRTAKGTYKRPITRLCILPID